MFFFFTQSSVPIQQQLKLPDGLCFALVQHQLLRLVSCENRLLHIGVCAKMIGVSFYGDIRVLISVSCFLNTGMSAGVIGTHFSLLKGFSGHRFPTERRRSRMHAFQAATALFVSGLQFIVGCFANIAAIAPALPHNASAQAFPGRLQRGQTAEFLPGNIFCPLLAMIRF